MKKSRKRIHGNDRGYMMLAKDVRRRWAQYGENRKKALDLATFNEPPLKAMHYACYACHIILIRKQVQVDHVKPLGARPRKPAEFCTYIWNMFNRKCQILCKNCHQRKTNVERKKRRS